MYFLKASEQIVKLYKLFRKLDCVQLEINPFAETPDGRGIYQARIERKDLCIRGINFEFV